jgi:hypothetical protein
VTAVAWIDDGTVRLPPGPVDDCNTWPHCRHCDDDEYPCAVLVHDEPCLECQATPEPEEG